MRFPRKSGLLVHLTALPSLFGVGDMGPNAYHFIDMLEENEQSMWQILPIGVADDKGCPYSSLSAFGGYELLVSPELLCDVGLLTLDDYKDRPQFNEQYTDFKLVSEYKRELFLEAFKQFNSQNDPALKKRYRKFINDEKDWVHDLALFQTLSHHYGMNWAYWPIPFKSRDLKELATFAKRFDSEVKYYKFMQFIFFEQWMALKDYAGSKGIQLVGDIPIFVSHHSMDVWKHPEWFKIDKNGHYDVEVGAAPDVFSAIGQKWANPNYDWHEMEREGFSWWISRFRFMLKYFDIIRLDHFRGFHAVWEVRSSDPDATGGWWAYSSGYQLFKKLEAEFGDLPLIVEDLGTITHEVDHLRDCFDLPGMKVLQMAFASGDEDVNLPHNIPENCAIYTATHDNDTSRGYFWKLDNSLEKQFVHNYLQTGTLHWVNWDLIRMALYSRANTAITPIQDIMGLGSEARFNTPGTTYGNWSWRFSWDDLKSDDLNLFKHITKDSGRSSLEDDSVSDTQLSLRFQPLENRT